MRKAAENANMRIALFFAKIPIVFLKTVFPASNFFRQRYSPDIGGLRSARRTPAHSGSFPQDVPGRPVGPGVSVKLGFRGVFHKEMTKNAKKRNKAFTKAFGKK